MLTDQWKFFLYEKSNIDRRKVHDSDSSKFPIQSLSSFPWKYFGCYANSIIAEIVWWELNISHFDPYVRPTGTVPHKNKKEKNVNICAWSQVKYATKMDFQPDTGQEYSIQGIGHPWSFLTHCDCSESAQKKTLRLESALEDWWSCLMACDRPSHTLQHLLTRIQRFLNFLEILENFQILGH